MSTKNLIAYALLAITAIFILAACSQPGQKTNDVTEINKSRNERLSEHKSLLEANTIVENCKSSSYHYHFTDVEQVNSFYSRRRGFLSEQDAQSNTGNPIIEIQLKPNTDEVKQVYYKMKGLPSLNVSLKDVTPMLDFVAMFDSNAAGVFRRNFITVFHYTANGPDSNHYYDKSKGISIGIDHNLDIVRQDRQTAKDAYIQASIAPY